MRKFYRYKSLRNLFLILMMFFFVASANAQCAMCRAALQSEGDTKKAEAVNDGIVYLMVIPYVLVAVIGVVVYQSRKSAKAGN